MPVHVRMKKDTPGLRIGADAVVDAESAKAMKDEDLCWITGGDAADMEAFGLVSDPEVPPPIHYDAPPSAIADVVKKEG